MAKVSRFVFETCKNTLEGIDFEQPLNSSMMGPASVKKGYTPWNDHGSGWKMDPWMTMFLYKQVVFHLNEHFKECKALQWVMSTYRRVTLQSTTVQPVESSFYVQTSIASAGSSQEDCLKPSIPQQWERVLKIGWRMQMY